jgi:hypothetical protein
MSVTIVDNILSEEKFNNLSDEVLSRNFPWFFNRTPPSHGGVNDIFLHGWGNTVLFREQVMYDPNNTLLQAAENILIQAGEDLQELLRVRLILNTATDKNYENGAHVDISYEHRTALFYFNDSDGDTIVYNERFDPDYGPDTNSFYKEKITHLTQLTAVTPKANRLFIFDGLHYHTGTTPTTVPRRVVMNINYQVKGMKKL